MSVISNNQLAGAAGQGGADAGYTIQRSLRFNSEDSSNLSRTPSSAGNRRTFTFSCWTKLGKFGTAQTIISAYDGSSTNQFEIRLQADDTFFLNTGGNSGNRTIAATSAVYRDPSAWYHLVCAVDTTEASASNHFKFYINGILQTLSLTQSGPQNLTTHVNGTFLHQIGVASGPTRYFDGYLADLHLIDGQAVDPTAFGGFDVNGVWQAKAFDGTYGTNSFHLDFSDNSSNAALGTDTSGNNNNFSVNNLTATAIDYLATGTYTASEWDTVSKIEHIFDGNDGTLAHRPNSAGTGISTFTFGTPVTVTSSLQIRGWKGDSNERIFANGVDISSHFNTQSGGGLSTQNVTSTVGSTPFTLTSVGSENANNRAGALAKIIVDGVTLISAAAKDIDSLIDTPTNYDDGTNVGGNYATLNPLNKHNTADTFSEGNLKLTSSGSGSAHLGRSTIAMSSGKYYWEVTWDDTSQNFAGIQGRDDINYYNSYIYLSNAKASATNGSSEGSSYGASWGNGDVIGIAYDADNATLTFYKNGVSQGTAFTSITGTSSPYPSGYVAFFGNWSGQACTFNVNFGQRPFKHPVSGYKSLCTTNLPQPVIADGSTAFDVVTWSGTGSSQTISTGFDPDLIWSKTRNYAVDHKLVDSVRGFTKQLETNQTIAEYTNTTGVTGTSSTGFTIGTGNDWNNPLNRTYVGWAWDAGSSNTSISAGGLNSSLYDQSQTWSSSLTSTQTFNLATTRAFDGDLSTLAATANATTANILFTKTFTNVTKLRIYMDHDYQNYRVRINSGTWYTDSALGATANAGWRDLTSIIPANGTVNSIESDTGGQNNGVNWSAVEVNGALLVDSGVSVTNVPTIASTVRANPLAGVSIVSFQGNGSTNQTVGHSLNAKPSLVIYKDRDSTSAWRVIATFINDGHYLALNSNQAGSTNTAYFGTNTSSVIGISGSNSGIINANGNNIIAYCFAPVEGYSAFGSYTANGSSTDGPFVYTGFAVAWLMTKRDNANGNWEIHDLRRPGYNPQDERLLADGSTTEVGGNNVDLLSNGFKVRNSFSGMNNTNGDTYLYAAFAEHPMSLNGGLAR